MNKYRLTKTITSELVEEFEIRAKTEEKAIELANDYNGDIDGIIELVAGIDNGFDCEIVVDSEEVESDD